MNYQKSQKPNQKVTKRQIASVTIYFNGESYYADLQRSNMTGSGWLYFLESHADIIKDIKVQLYANHIAEFGFCGQKEPNLTSLEVFDNE